MSLWSESGYVAAIFCLYAAAITIGGARRWPARAGAAVVLIVGWQPLLGALMRAIPVNGQSGQTQACLQNWLLLLVASGCCVGVAADGARRWIRAHRSQH